MVSIVAGNEQVVGSAALMDIQIRNLHESVLSLTSAARKHIVETSEGVGVAVPLNALASPAGEYQRPEIIVDLIRLAHLIPVRKIARVRKVVRPDRHHQR
jgi:hypothetical protein